MKVLVCAASRHGATAEIAEHIGSSLGQALQENGVRAEVEVHPAEEVRGVEGYDAVVLGSAVYMGRWLEPARRILTEERAALAERPVWLFSSGPVGDQLRPEDEPNDVPDAMASTRAREHRTFAGRIDRKALSLSEKMLVVALQVPDGDYRDFHAVQEWARGIATSLGGGDESGRQPR